MRIASRVLITLSFASLALSQTYTISTFAGAGMPVGASGTSAGISDVTYMTADAAGDLYFVYHFSVLRMAANGGPITLVAGRGTTGFSGDGGPASNAELNNPSGLAVDSAGNLYIADTLNNRVRKVSNGVITTVAGNGTAGFTGDGGPATNAELNLPCGVAVDSAGNLYIGDSANRRVRKVSNGVITTIAGNGTAGFTGDGGPATNATLFPLAGSTMDLAVDSAGNLYIADYENYRVRKVSNGIITTVAGNGTVGVSTDGVPATASSVLPGSLAVDAAGNVYIGDSSNNTIRKVSGGMITRFAGNGTFNYSGDGGPATSASLAGVDSLGVDASGNLYVANSGADRIREISAGVIHTVAGNGTDFGGDNGPANAAQLSLTGGIAVDSAGNVYISDTFNSRVREVSGGVITTVAGNGTDSYSGDNGPATGAGLGLPLGLAVDASGNLYIADYTNLVVREVSHGIITTIAGTGALGFSGDGGPAVNAKLGPPSGVALDSDGNLYIADPFNHRVRKVSNGVITTVAGNGTNGYGGDGGLATSAQLSAPTALAVDSSGNLYILDSTSQVIRKVSGGVITTIAGSGVGGFAGDKGPAAQARFGFFSISGISVDSSGNLFVTDTYNGRIREVSNGIVTTIAGTGGFGYSGDGDSATSAVFYAPTALAGDSSGNLYVGNFRGPVRMLTPVVPTALTTSVSLISSLNPSSLAQPVTFTAMVATTGGPTGAGATGTVQFSDGTKTLATVPVRGGQATFTTSSLGGGAHRITAAYSGDPIFPSAQTNLNQVVYAPITMTVSATPQTAETGQPITFSVTVAANSIPAGLSSPGGTVTFAEENGFPFVTFTSLGTATLTSGTATFTVNSLSAGQHYIEVEYGGDGTWPAAYRQLLVTVSPASNLTVPSEP